MKCQRQTTKGQQCSANLRKGKCQYHGQKEPTPVPEKVDLLPITIPNSLDFLEYLNLRLADNGFDRDNFVESQAQSIWCTDPEVAGFAWNRFMDRCEIVLSKEENAVFTTALKEFFNPVPRT